MFPLPQVPPKYEYTYGVNDDYQKVMFDQSESRDGYKTTGSYSVRLPDGRKQTVTYVDNGDGLEAEVTYEGEVIVDSYPSHPHPAPPSYPRQPYFPAYPSHPAPAALVEAEPETVIIPEAAPVEADNAAPVKLVEAPVAEEIPAEEVEEEEVESSPAEEEEKTSNLEEAPEEDVTETEELSTSPPEV